MNCAKCGMPMPPGSGACPNCGLKIKQAPASSPPGATQPLPQGATPPAPGPQPMAGQGPPTGAFAPAVQPPPSDPYAYTASPSDPYAQHILASPGEPTPPSFRGGPVGYSNKAKSDSSSKLIYVLVAAVVVAVAVVGVLYFTVMKHGPAGPEATVQTFFTYAAKDDVQGMSALCTADAQPTQEDLAKMRVMFGPSGMCSVSDFKMSESNKTPTSVTVTVDDATMTVDGRSRKFSDLGIAGMLKINLKLINGQWLIAD